MKGLEGVTQVWCQTGRRGAPVLALLVGVVCWVPFQAARSEQTADFVTETQLKQYDAEQPKTILDLQPFRRTETLPIGGSSGRATLVNLNPAIGDWYLLRVDPSGGGRERSYHLQVSDPDRERLSLDSQFPDGVLIDMDGRRVPCALWSASAAVHLEQAASEPTPYAPLCEGRIYLRNPTRGHKTLLESATDFLRDHVWGGEQAVRFVRDTVLKDRALESRPLAQSSSAPEVTRTPRGPSPAAVDPADSDRVMKRGELGLALDLSADDRLAVGQWYPLRGQPGMFAGEIEPGVIDPRILQSYRDRVTALDGVEARAVVYLIAFDLSRFDLGFALGTDHPRVGWSDRTLPQVRDDRLPGPDGIDTIKPLVATGMVPPPLVPRVVATFTGGFKRQHSAFKWGDLALRNHGSHYGFIEEGVIASKLQPGLATLYVSADGRIDMKTWTGDDNSSLASVRYARQNGVPLVEFDETRHVAMPGALVNRWGPGNWSGSQDVRLRTLRAGACLQETQQGRYLIYAYFSGATPSAMARVFQAYHCHYAMQLDINALEHTYLAVYSRVRAQRVVEHLVKGMSVLDEEKGDTVVPRFVGYADNRDFFYLVRHAN